MKLVHQGQVHRTRPITVSATTGATQWPLSPFDLGTSCPCLAFSLSFSTKQRKFRQQTRTGLLSFWKFLKIHTAGPYPHLGSFSGGGAQKSLLNKVSRWLPPTAKFRGSGTSRGVEASPPPGPGTVSVVLSPDGQMFQGHVTHDKAHGQWLSCSAHITCVVS